jgi:hypothetical protein
MSTAADPVWFRDAWVLVAPDQVARILPMYDMTRNERSNALMRLSLLYALVGALVFRSAAAFVLPLVAALVTAFMYGDELAALGGGGRTEAYPGGEGCRKPTRDNPFMNANLFEPEKARPACDALDPRVKRRIEAEEDKTLFRDVDDLYNRNNSTRQFYTMPSTGAPNQQMEFAQWLYGETGQRRGAFPPPAGAR